MRIIFTNKDRTIDSFIEWIKLKSCEKIYLSQIREIIFQLKQKRREFGGGTRRKREVNVV